MKERPVNVTLALILALLGVLFAIAATVVGLDVGSDGLIARMAFSTLTLVLFLAVIGSLKANGQWTWSFMIFAEALCAAVPIIGYAYGAMDLFFCLALVIIACAVILLTATVKARRWIEAERV